MTFKKRLISGIGALVFIVLMALNVQLVQNPTGDKGVSNLTLVELAAKADGGDECTMSQTCSGGICSVLNAKKRFFNGCIKKCDYTCTVQGIPTFP